MGRYWTYKNSGSDVKFYESETIENVIEATKKHYANCIFVDAHRVNPHYAFAYFKYHDARDSLEFVCYIHEIKFESV